MADYVDTARRTVRISKQELTTLGTLVAGDEGHEGIVVYQRREDSDDVIGVLPLGSGPPYCFGVDEFRRRELEVILSPVPTVGDFGWMDFIAHPRSMAKKKWGFGRAITEDGGIPGCGISQLRRRTGTDPASPGYRHHYRCLLIGYNPKDLNTPLLRVCVPDPVIGGLVSPDPRKNPIITLPSPNHLDTQKLALDFDFYCGAKLLETATRY